MQQLVQPNLTIVGKPGYCLAYTEDVYGTPHLYANATEGWQQAQFKHTDQPPAGLSVPLWFSFDDPDGHVCVWANNQVYSTTAQGMKTFANVQALLNYMNNGTVNEHMVYLGWSEDLATVRIVEESPVEKVDLSAARIFAYFILGRNGVYNPVNALAGQCDDDLNKNHVGQPLTVQYVQGLYGSTESVNFNKWVQAGGSGYVPYKGQLYTKG